MKKTALVCLFCLCLLPGAFGDAAAITRRFGIFVGSNDGGRDRTTLRYAVSDARAVSRVFTEMGGINAADSVLLIEPDLAELDRQIDALHRRVIAAKQTHKRTEIVFYYSGHSDEEGLLINRDRYQYRELRGRITNIPSDMRVVILDSCSSGAFTRAKGGVKTQPFLFDDSMATEGYAFLSSSSAAEASQESDAIGGSYFTHSLLAGLRGAADTVGDGRVTLNEVYRYAYTETLARTEVSRYGAQHPSYDMQISGTGDMVLTDIKETSAGLILGEDLAGRLSIRDASDYLVVELTKNAGKAMELGLEPGPYRITLQRGNTYSRAEITLNRGERVKISPADFTIVAAPPARARGEPGEPGGPEEDAGPLVPVTVQLVPGVGFPEDEPWATNILSFGLISTTGHNLRGLTLSLIGSTNTGFVRGIQFSLIYNYAHRDLQGIQAAGFFNMAFENVQGIQIAGIFNTTGGTLQGIQAAGIFNTIGGTLRGIQGAGVFNRLEGDGMGIQAAGVANFTKGSMRGIQGANLVNWTGGSFQGIQTAGIANFTKGSMQGTQWANVFNWTGGSFQGLQVGLVNYRGGGDGPSGGVMVGLVNISKSEDVAPFGLVNIVKNGMLHPAIGYDDLGFLNLSLKSGSKRFYSLFSLGLRNMRSPQDMEFTNRIGAGVEIPLGNIFIDLDLSAGNIQPLDSLRDDPENHSLLAQARVSAGFKLFEHLGAFAGISYDYILSPPDRPFRTESVFGIPVHWTNGRHAQKIGFFGGVQF